MSSDQLELFGDGPFSFRITIPDAIGIFWNLYFKQRASAGPCKPHFARIAAFLKTRHMDTVTKHDVEALRRHYGQMGFSPATTNKAHVILTLLYNKFWEWKEAGKVGDYDFSKMILPQKDRNPGKLVPKVNERQFARKVAISKEKVFRLAAFAKQLGYYDLQDTILGLYWSRLRQGDLFRLTALNVDSNHGLLQGVQHKTITTKHPSGVPYLVVMGSDLKELVSVKMLQVRSGGYLFPKPVDLQKKYAQVRRVAGLEYVTLQDLRRSAATHLLDNGTDPRTVAESLGHTTLRMLPSYTPRTLKHHREASEKLSSVQSSDGGN